MRTLGALDGTAIEVGLERLDADQLVAFAGACAERELVLVRGVDPVGALAEEALLEELWRHLLGQRLTHAELERMARHAADSGRLVLAAAFRCASTHSVEDAAAAAREAVRAEVERQIHDVEQLLGAPHP